MENGITELYYNFLKYLEEEKDKIALIQLTGKIEDYLVKEFVYYIYKKTEGKTFALVNLGIRGEKKIDIVLLKGNMDNPVIHSLIEAKYLRNKHRITNYDATDEISTSLKSLHEQIGPFKSETLGGYKVKLSARSKNIYGLVFASYVSKVQKDEQNKKCFYKRILRIAEKFFRYHDLKKPYFRFIFDDVYVNVLNTKFYVSLRAGLWKNAENGDVK
jgi:hypothetical protein